MNRRMIELQNKVSTPQAVKSMAAINMGNVLKGLSIIPIPGRNTGAD